VEVKHVFVLCVPFVLALLRPVADKRTMSKTRIVVYLDAKEARAAKAKQGEHKNLHRWAAAVVRRALK